MLSSYIKIVGNTPILILGSENVVHFVAMKPPNVLREGVCATAPPLLEQLCKHEYCGHQRPHTSSLYLCHELCQVAGPHELAVSNRREMQPYALPSPGHGVHFHLPGGSFLAKIRPSFMHVTEMHLADDHPSLDSSSIIGLGLTRGARRLQRRGEGSALPPK